MLNTFSFCEYGDVEIRYAMFDIDGTNLQEGIEIKFLDDDVDLPTIEILDYIDIDELTADDVEKLIEDNLRKLN